MKILIAEDDRIFRTLIEATVIKAGYGVVTATDGHEAWRLLQEEDGPQIAILDWMMPGLDGLEICRRVRQRGGPRYIYVLLLTGRSSRDDLIAGLEAGADDYLTKPVDRNELRVRLRTGQRILDLEATLNETRRRELEAKDHLLSHVSHELLTPLNAAYQFVTLLQDHVVGPITTEQGDCLGVAVRNLKQLQKMIQDLLDATRAQTGRLTIERRPISIAEVVNDLVCAMSVKATAKGLTLSSTVPNGLAPVLADPARVRQIVTNLIDNAMKFTPAPGRILATATADDSQGHVRVSISDTGRGIPPDARDQIFERLYQQAPLEDSRKGLGLGLYICKELVNLQGGRIWVESTEGQGSTFSFTLPVAPSATTESVS